jgi:hypothetical protein
MVRKLLPVFILFVLVTLACSVSFNVTEPPAPAPGGGVTPETGGITPEGGGVTPEVVLPPPAVAPPLQVVYSKSGNIWLWTEVSSPVQLTSSGTDRSPELNSDGTQVAFLHGDELWAINTDGSNLRLLVSGAYLASLVPPSTGTGVIHWFEWDPVYAYLWFGTSEQGEAYTIPVFDLHAVSAAGDSAPYMAENPGYGGVATFSPDGNKVALAQPTKIIFMYLDGTGYRDALTFSLVLTYSEWFYIPEVVWFSDSSEFRTVIPAHDPLSDPYEGTYFWSVPVSGSPVQMAGVTASPAFMDAPRISPDGLNFGYMSPNGANTDLYLNGFYIGNVMYTSYPSGQWGLVGWAPDSSGFVYWINDVRNLWLGTLGSAAVPLTDTAHTQDIRWVDLVRLLFISDNELRLGYAAGASSILDTGVDGGYDFYYFLP